MWIDSLQNHKKAEVGRAAQCANPQRSMTVVALTGKEGKQASKETQLQRKRRC